MKTVMLKPIVLKLAMVLVLTAIVWPAASGFAGRKATQLQGYYPAEFTFSGCIQRIRANDVVIDDSLLKFAPGATFNTLKAEDSGRSWFKPGRKVGVVVNEDHKIESLWYQRCE